HGGTAPHPGLPSEMEQGMSSPRPGRRSPTPEPPGTARAHFDRPGGQALAVPGEPGVARRVPDRGDDLTRGIVHRAISQGDHRSATATSGYPNAQVRAHDHDVRSTFQAGHEGPIPFARSDQKPQVTAQVTRRDDHQDRPAGPRRATYVPHGGPVRPF